MSISDWLMIFAVLLAPLIAIQVQKKLEIHREQRNRKLAIFKTLMATRASRLSADHVQALNMIDLEFYGKRYEKVVQSWKTYLDHLGNFPKDDEKAVPVWIGKQADLLADLLMEMGKVLDYEFDVVHVKKGIYYPEAHGKLEDQNALLREGILRLLYGDTALKMDVTNLPVHSEALEHQLKVHGAITDLLEGNRKLKVEIADDSVEGSAETK